MVREAALSQAPAKLAVTGLRTFMGRRLAERLVREESAPRVIGIDRHRPQGLDPKVDFRELDLTRPEAPSQLAALLAEEDIRTFVHLAFRRRPHSDLEADHELDVIGSLHVLGACAAAGVRKLVLSSTTMVYGARPDNPNFLTEDHPLSGHPDAHAVQNRIEVEQMVAEWSREHPDVAVTVLRLCWMVGPHYRDPVTEYLGRPLVPVLLGYDPPVQLVHEEDALFVFETAVLEEHPGTYNVVAPGVLPLSRLLRAAGARPLPLPSGLLSRLRSFPSQTRTGDRPEGFTDYLRYPWVADGARCWAAFGAPVYDTREAWMSFVTARRTRRLA